VYGKIFNEISGQSEYVQKFKFNLEEMGMILISLFTLQ
jgi:hypothetical protein